MYAGAVSASEDDVAVICWITRRKVRLPMPGLACLAAKLLTAASPRYSENLPSRHIVAGQRMVGRGVLVVVE